MRILHIVGTISPEAGGPTEAIRMLVKYAPEGYTSELATLDDPSAPFLATLPFPVHALGSGKKSWHSSRLTQWLRTNRDRFDGVMVHGLWEYTGLAVRRTIAGHIPYVVFPHGMLDPYFKHAFPAKHAKKWIFWLLAQYWVLRSAFRVLFTTAVERDLAKQSFWLHRWTPMVVGLGAEPPAQNPHHSIPAFHQRCPAVEGHKFLLFLGRIDRKKGCDLLLEAFAAVSALDPTLHLVMAGPDATNWAEDLKKIAANAGIADRVHWPGMLKDEFKWGAFAACEAFILPSHQENFGIAVVEALACSRPVLISNQINIAPDVLADGCALVEPDTLEGTKRLLQNWIAQPPAARAAMRQHARLSFEQRYDMRRNAESILRVFEQAPKQTPQKEEAR